jgi:hypothetical protein
MTFCEILFNVGLTGGSVAAGYLLAVEYDRDKTKKEFIKSYNLSMNALVASLRSNSRAIHQMFDIEFPAGTYPSYPLDTQALALIVFGASPYLSETTNTNLSEKFNSLRFEMEHINRRLLMEFVKHTQVDGNWFKKIYCAYNTNGEMPHPNPSQPLFGIATLLLALKTRTDAQVKELEGYGYHGEEIKVF